MTSRRRLAGHRKVMSIGATAVALVASLIVAPLQPAQADTKQQIAGVKQDLSNANAQLDALEIKAEQASELYNQARDQLVEVTRRSVAAQDKVARALATLDEKQKQVDSFVVAAYEGGGLPDFSAFTTTGSAQDTIDRLDSLGVVARNQDAALADLEIAKRAANQAQLEAQQILAEQQRVTDRVSAEKAAIADTVNQQVAIIDKLSAKETRLIAQAKAEAARAAARKAAAELAKRKAAAQAAAAALARQQAADEAARQAAAQQQNNNGGGSGSPDPAATGSNGAQIALKWAYAELGRPYVWGAAGPDTFDCSGL
ncbi:MAG: peptidoglycan DL-endopeptidase CwlO, partial [Frankiaceae bacterium]|nr:peptidoglycan DL-endopeptidase CwlO [Frankiaceae bacterium]